MKAKMTARQFWSRFRKIAGQFVVRRSKDIRVRRADVCPVSAVAKAILGYCRSPVGYRRDATVMGLNATFADLIADAADNAKYTDVDGDRVEYNRLIQKTRRKMLTIMGKM